MSDQQKKDTVKDPVKDLGIFIFRRDLRLVDNYALAALSKRCKEIIGVFILDPYQIVKKQHNKHYFSNKAVQFMCESLRDLDQQLKHKGSKLFLFYGSPHAIVAKLVHQFRHKTIAIGFNEDFSAYSIKRDNHMKRVCKRHNIEVVTSVDDYTLIPFSKMDKGYKQYGAFYKKMRKHKVDHPVSPTIHFAKPQIAKEFPIKGLSRFYKDSMVQETGGRSRALKILSGLHKWSKYNSHRDLLTYRTTEISAYLNFGCVSVREMYYAIKKHLGPSNQLVKQLYWRDFFLCAVRFLPGATQFKHMDKRFDKIKWTNSKSGWTKLMNSQTGFLLVDAGITQMRQTGYMHNRARLLVGSFWCKYLLINPFHKSYGSQVGFSAHLVDAIGPSQNKMNHHWLTEFDYSGKKFAPKGHPLAGRPMNPDNSMIKKWDPTGEYIKTWLPHLKKVPVKDLIHWNTNTAKEYKSTGHPGPMFDTKEQYKQWVKRCKG
jgi:deoxyribodipyrimidine photo-lyase